MRTRRNGHDVWGALAVAALLATAGCKRSDESLPRPPPPMPGGAPSMPPPGAGAPPAPPPANEITMLEDLVRRDPNNREAWVRLGNDYFDSHQPQKSIAAYGKALEIKGDDPDVLTDQGVMYREIGMYDNALKNFEKAHQADPKHLTSLFNQGIVWAFDKKDPKKATAVWQEVIKKDPAGPNGQKARDLITQFQSGAPPPAR